MGQFLGFTHDHSSLIANVINLRTIYISPQCHVFMTTFNHFSSGDNNMVVDAISIHCSKIIKIAEDEFGVDGELIYSLLSLEEVLLSDLECQDRRENIPAHCRQNNKCQCI